MCAALLLGACSNPLGPQRWQRVIGLIEVGGEMPLPVRAPTEVRVGETFAVTVVTFGSSSCTRPDGAEIRQNGLSAEITPYDEEATGRGVVCTDDLRGYPRDVALRFAEPGQARIRVVGRSFSGAAEFSVSVQVTP